MVVILAFSFNLRGKEPGLSNEAIGREIKRYISEDFWSNSSEPIFILSQWEVDKVLKSIKVGSDFVVRFHHVMEKYLDTKEVAEQMYGFINKHKMLAGNDFYACAAAHQDHMPRVLRTLKKIGINAKPMPMKEKIPYDPKGDQWWTRARWRFLLREWLIARPLEFLGLV